MVRAAVRESQAPLGRCWMYRAQGADGAPPGPYTRQNVGLFIRGWCRTTRVRIRLVRLVGALLAVAALQLRRRARFGALSGAFGRPHPPGLDSLYAGLASRSGIGLCRPLLRDTWVLATAYRYIASSSHPL